MGGKTVTRKYFMKNASKNIEVEENKETKESKEMKKEIKDLMKCNKEALELIAEETKNAAEKN